MGDRVAVLIDGDNIPHYVFEQVLEYAHAYGNIVFFKIYGNKSAIRAWKSNLPTKQKRALCIDFHQNAIQKRNSSDISLTIDAMDLLFHETVDRFCIVSCDSDFYALIERIQQHEKDVCVISTQKTTQLFAIATHRAPIENNNTRKKTNLKHLNSRFVALVKQAIKYYKSKNRNPSVSDLGTYLKDCNFDWKALGCHKLIDLLRQTKACKLCHINNQWYLS